MKQALQFDHGTNVMGMESIDAFENPFDMLDEQLFEIDVLIL